MGLKSFIILKVAGLVASDIHRWKKKAVSDQLNVMNHLISRARTTVFGIDHNFGNIYSYEDFKRNIPVRDYEELRQYIDMVTSGKPDILWPGKPKYFAKTSGTTSGVKYIPISRESMPNHINTARNAMLNYFHRRGNADVFGGKLIFLSGSPVLDEKGGVPTGRLSGIVNHEVPAWVKSNQLPSYETNCIDDWEIKLEHITKETMDRDMRLISGIPPWVQMYFERILEVTGKKTVLEIFPNFSLFMYGGVNFEPYRTKLEELIGRRIDSMETYPASEGFIAFQDEINDSGLLLNTNSGIFFEFVQVEDAFEKNPERCMLSDVQLNKDYLLIINNNAGLWGYNIGDVVRFVSINPYKIIVTGRVKHYISAFGEHVIGKEVEEAILTIANKQNVSIVEFTVAPQVNPPDGSQPYHEWFVEFYRPPADLDKFALSVDAEMCKQNIYYQDLISGNILQPLKIRAMKKDSFRNYMKTQGKLGGQNKVPRLSNDRKIAEDLTDYIS
ncbi:MAG: GH3 auxin-responsive promoter family protein [Saprospiraceae bacterium]|nr:GH3 auxin-responsive promoter family protein [Saprospiraceae bacterium]